MIDEVMESEGRKNDDAKEESLILCNRSPSSARGWLVDLLADVSSLLDPEPVTRQMQVS